MSERKIEDIRHKRKWHIWLVLIVALAVTLFPIFWTLVTSFKPSTEIQAVPQPASRCPLSWLKSTSA
jgi:ABC-type glycerol-3-phosphate transport system permease component